MNQPLPERARDLILHFVNERREGRTLIDPEDTRFGLHDDTMQWARDWWAQDGVVTCFTKTRVGERNWALSILAPLFGIEHAGWVKPSDEPFGFINRRKLLMGRDT